MAPRCCNIAGLGCCYAVSMRLSIGHVAVLGGCSGFVAALLLLLCSGTCSLLLCCFQLWVVGWVGGGWCGSFPLCCCAWGGGLHVRYFGAALVPDFFGWFVMAVFGFHLLMGSLYSVL